MSEDENNKKQNSSIIKKGLKEGFKRLPLSVKLWILGGVGIALLVLLLVTLIAGAIPSIFLDYSNDVSETGDVSDEYTEYWADFCDESNSGCSKEQIEAAKELEESQKKFYEKLDTLLEKYNVTDPTQRYLVLTTVFYDYDIDDFTEGNDAYYIDSTDEIDFEVNTENGNVYEEEADTLKELIKQFKVYSATCTFTCEESSENCRDDYLLKDSNNKNFILNFFDKFKSVFGIDPNYEGYKEAKNTCENEGGKVVIEQNSSNEASVENFYNYLKNSEYLDKKEHLKSYYVEYARTNGLDTEDFSTWPEEDLKIVRENIVKNIKEIVDDYVDDNVKYLSMGSGLEYWWPIGSNEVTEESGISIASGEPAFTLINSPYGMRFHPVYNEYRLHNGIDLHGIAGSTNVIASMGGTVINVVNSCDSFNSNGCGGGYGNYVEIQDSKGNVELYAHMYLNSITVSVNDTVKQGQVIGKVGSSGTSTGQHLHFTIKINGVAVDPLNYVDPNNPRPTGYSSISFNTTAYTKEEFVAKLKNYYSQSGICTSSNSGCASFKKEILSNGANIIYDTGLSYNINPELLVARVVLEGYSPGSSYNYFGYGCTNTGGLSACYRFTSFSSSVDTWFKNASKYDSLEAMMSKYAYLGDYWYTGTNWGLGGCAYASYIYPSGIPERVSNACSKPANYCTRNSTANCTPTTEEDKSAYTAWQVQKMATVVSNIFS